MAETKTSAETEVTEVAATDVKAVKASKATEATVVWKQGERTYTKEVHGNDFADLAAQFAAKFEGTVTLK